jgi:hypothetical protein
MIFKSFLNSAFFWKIFVALFLHQCYFFDMGAFCRGAKIMQIIRQFVEHKAIASKQYEFIGKFFSDSNLTELKD